MPLDFYRCAFGVGVYQSHCLYLLAIDAFLSIKLHLARAFYNVTNFVLPMVFDVKQQAASNYNFYMIISNTHCTCYTGETWTGDETKINNRYVFARLFIILLIFQFPSTMRSLCVFFVGSSNGFIDSMDRFCGCWCCCVVGDVVVCCLFDTPIELLGTFFQCYHISFTLSQMLLFFFIIVRSFGRFARTQRWVDKDKSKRPFVSIKYEPKNAMQRVTIGRLYPCEHLL